MAIKFKCKQCKTELNVKDEMAGKQGKCPKCKAVMTVPSAAIAEVPVKKKVVEDDVVAAEVVEEEDDVVDPVEEIQDEAPRRKKKPVSRRDDDDEDERPRRKSRRDDDDDDDDDRPRRKRRRDDDDDEEDDDRRSVSPKKRRAALKRASLGVFLTSISAFIYAGALLISMMCWILGTGGAGMGGSSGLDSIIKIFGWLLILAFTAALVLAIVGASFTLMTPARFGSLGLSIANLACAGLSLLMFVLLILNVLDSSRGGGSGAGALVGILMLNPLSGIKGEGGLGFILLLVFGGVGFAIYLLPLLELGRLTCFALWQWAVCKTFKDRDGAKSALLLGVLTPSICFGMGLLFWIMTLAIKTPSRGIFIMLIIFYFISYIGVMGYYGFASLSARGTLDSER